MPMMTLYLAALIIEEVANRAQVVINQAHKKRPEFSSLSAHAMSEAFRLVNSQGNAITPAPLVMVSRMPAPVTAALFWIVSRMASLRKMTSLQKEAGVAEPRSLIDEMNAAAPGQIPRLLAIRP